MDKTYAISVSDTITQRGALPRLIIDHPAARGEVFLQGAHLAAWQPAGSAPVIFMSPKAHFAPGKAIRGGVPVCFPWFGAAPNDKLPAHGFARTIEWTFVGAKSTPTGASVHLQLGSDEMTHQMWKSDFVADLRATFGSQLDISLRVTNTGEAETRFEAALHTYYIVSDARQVSVTGLTGTEYLDKPDGLRRKTETEPAIRFVKETDRVYLNTEATCTIDDPGMARKIIIEKTGSRSTVVWNPFPERASQISDLGESNWPGFVCIETANIAENAVVLAPGKSHEMTARVRVVGR